MDKSADSDLENSARARLDLWLWAVRLYKTRSLATAACRGGKVRLHGKPAKPAHPVRVGDRIEVRRGAVTRDVEVKAILNRRVGAPLVEEYLIDHTPPEVYQEAARRRQMRNSAEVVRDEGSGRPTKKDRRALSKEAEKAARREAAITDLMRKSVKGSSGE